MFKLPLGVFFFFFQGGILKFFFLRKRKSGFGKWERNSKAPRLVGVGWVVVGAAGLF